MSRSSWWTSTAPKRWPWPTAFLPTTNAVWGRPSTPRAKRLYLCPGVEKTVAFKDLASDKEATVLELRAKHQDMAPPSRFTRTANNWSGHAVVTPRTWRQSRFFNPASS